MDEFLLGWNQQARVFLFFIAQRRDRFTVVVAGIDADVVRKRLQYRQTFILRFGVSAGQIGPSAAADQQSITGENAILEQQTCRVLRVARCVDDIEQLLSEADLIAVLDGNVHIGRVGGAVHDYFNAEPFAHHFASGAMIGVRVGIDRVEDL